MEKRKQKAGRQNHELDEKLDLGLLRNAAYDHVHDESLSGLTDAAVGTEPPTASFRELAAPAVGKSSDMPLFRTA